MYRCKFHEIEIFDGDHLGIFLEVQLLGNTIPFGNTTLFGRTTFGNTALFGRTTNMPCEKYFGLGKRAKWNRKKKMLAQDSVTGLDSYSFEDYMNERNDYDPFPDEFDGYLSDEYTPLKPWECLTDIDHENYHPDNPYLNHEMDEYGSCHDDLRIGRWMNYKKPEVKNVVIVIPFNLVECLDTRISGEVGIYHNQKRDENTVVNVMHLNINNTLEMFCSSLYENFQLRDITSLVNFIQPRAKILMQFLPPTICGKIMMYLDSDMCADEVTLPLISQLVKVYTGQNCRLL